MAKRPEVQQRQMVQHWRVSWSLLTQLRISVDLFLSPKLSFQCSFFSVLGEHSLTTGRETRTAWPSSTTSTTTASGESQLAILDLRSHCCQIDIIHVSGSTTCPATTESLQSARRSQSRAITKFGAKFSNLFVG